MARLAIIISAFSLAVSIAGFWTATRTSADRVRVEFASTAAEAHSYAALYRVEATKNQLALDDLAACLEPLKADNPRYEFEAIIETIDEVQKEIEAVRADEADVMRDL